jgi:hypothetical protein
MSHIIGIVFCRDFVVIGYYTMNHICYQPYYGVMFRLWPQLETRES